ncbi:MAG: hypothetical protein IJS49_03010 [Paludibacteraceae bacterium]|nr:hypothetical protein [Paludibacteraceae bacterium]
MPALLGGCAGCHPASSIFPHPSSIIPLPSSFLLFSPISLPHFRKSLYNFLRPPWDSLAYFLPRFALLPHGGEHRMPSYMVNVTGENVGAYRLLPNGVHFSEHATIAVPYDDFLLPMGYNPKDIKTYYFDEDLAQWKHTNNAKSEFSASFVGKKRGFFDKNADFSCRIQSFFVILQPETLIFATGIGRET